MTDNTSPEWADANKGPTIQATIIAVSVVTTLFTFARLWVRGQILRQFHVDDWLIVFSVLCCWASVGLAIVAIDHGNGRHVDVLTQKQQEDVMFWTLAGFPLGILSFGVPKLAVVSVLTRIMNPGRCHTIVLWTMAGTCNVLLVINAVFLLGRCVPAEAQWNFDMEGRCWDVMILVRYAIATGIFSAFVDLYLAIYPGVILFSLGIKRKKKIALTVALGLGCVSTAVAIVKCTRLPLLAAEDFSWETADLVVLNIVEGGTLIIASCIPVLQPLLRIIMRREPLATSGTPGQAAYNGGAISGNPLGHGEPGTPGPAIVLYPTSNKSAFRMTYDSGEHLVDHSADEEVQNSASDGGQARRESYTAKALRRYSSVRQSVRQSIIGVAR